MKNSNILVENDINCIIQMYYDNYTEEEIASVLAESIRQNGINEIIDNLKSRNQTKVISEILFVFEEFKRSILK